VCGQQKRFTARPKTVWLLKLSRPLDTSNRGSGIGTNNMWITQSVATRIFVWLAAIAIPFQGLPSASCGCARAEMFSYGPSKTNCCNKSGARVFRIGETNFCCQAEPTCCSAKVISDGNCQCDAGCQCGDDCQCGKSNVPAEPSVPPVGNNSHERIVADSIGTVDYVAFYLPSTTRQRVELHAGANALTALACCVALCRFAL